MWELEARVGRPGQSHAGVGGRFLAPKQSLRTWRVVLPMCCASVDTLRLHSQADELLGGAEDDPLTVKQACWASLSASPVVWI